jgi:hypothetical protein
MTTARTRKAAPSAEPEPAPDAPAEAPIQLAVVPAPVYEVWAKVMTEAQSLGKNQRYDGGQKGGSFSYRGIDDLMNLVGPLLRRHGLAIIPSVEVANYRDIVRSGGGASREITVQVTYTIIGPLGDTMVGRSVGEAIDNGDKGTAKAMSVAYRVFLLQSLCLPTDEPDPDSEVYERSSAPAPGAQAQSVYDGLPGAATFDVVDRVQKWAADRSLLELPVTDPEGNAMPLQRAIDLRLEALDPQRFAERQAAVDQALGGGWAPAGANGEPSPDEVGDR